MGAVNNYQFAIGNGATTAFTLQDPSMATAISPSVTALYRTDWQGKQLLYTTSRTNLILQSNNFTVTWGGNTIGSITQNVTGPDGVANSAWSITGTGSDSNLSQTVAGLTVAHTYTNSIWLKVPSGTLNLNTYINDNGTGFKMTPIVLTTSWQRFTDSAVLSATGNAQNLQIGGGSTWGVGQVIHLAFAQKEDAAAATSYIPTTTTSASNTDYSVAGAVATVTPAPIAGATLSWTGTDSNGPFIPSHADGNASTFGAMGVR